MRHGRDYWSRHVVAWRRSGLSKKAYSEQHELAYWSMLAYAIFYTGIPRFGRLESSVSGCDSRIARRSHACRKQARRHQYAPSGSVVLLRFRLVNGPGVRSPIVCPPGVLKGPQG